MTIFKLRTRHPVLHPHITDLVVREEGIVEIEARRFGALINRAGRHQVVVPWQNVAEVEVDDAEGFLDATDEPTDDPLPRASRRARAEVAEALHPLPLQRQKVDATWRAVKDPASPAKKRK